MRWVTAKPPNILMVARMMPPIASERIHTGAASPEGAIWISAPIAMMLLIALVTLISGVCSAGLTFQTTM